MVEKGKDTKGGNIETVRRVSKVNGVSFMFRIHTNIHVQLFKRVCGPHNADAPVSLSAKLV